MAFVAFSAKYARSVFFYKIDRIHYFDIRYSLFDIRFSIVSFSIKLAAAQWGLRCLTMHAALAGQRFLNSVVP